MTARATHADDQRRQAEVAQAPNPRRELLPGVHTVGGRSRELGQLADDHVDRGTGKEPGHDGQREEARKPAELEGGDQQEQGTGQDRDRRHQLRRVGAAEAGQEDRAAGNGRQRRAGPGRDVS